MIANRNMENKFALACKRFIEHLDRTDAVDKFLAKVTTNDNVQETFDLGDVNSFSFIENALIIEGKVSGDLMIFNLDNIVRIDFVEKREGVGSG